METKPAVPAPVTEPAPPVTEPAPVDEEMKEDEGPVESAEKKEEPMEEISTPGVQEEEESDDEEESGRFDILNVIHWHLSARNFVDFVR